MSNLNNTTLANNMEGGNEVYFINLLHHKIPKMLDCLEGFLYQMRIVFDEAYNNELEMWTNHDSNNEKVRIGFISEMFNQLATKVDEVNFAEDEVFEITEDFYNERFEDDVLYENLFCEILCCKCFVEDHIKEMVKSGVNQGDDTLQTLDCVYGGLTAILTVLDVIG